MERYDIPTADVPDFRADGEASEQASCTSISTTSKQSERSSNPSRIPNLQSGQQLLICSSISLEVELDPVDLVRWERQARSISVLGSHTSWLTRSSTCAAASRVDAQPSHSTMFGRIEKTNLIDQYLAFLLMVFLDAGLVEVSHSLWERKTGYEADLPASTQALASIAATSQEKAAANKVALLISEILQLANRILPVKYAAHAQVCGRVLAS